MTVLEEKLNRERNAFEIINMGIPSTFLSSRLKELNIDHLDLLDGFINSLPEYRLFKPNDTHWNIAENKLASDLIFDKILDILN